jgi:hypothetical protein
MSEKGGLERGLGGRDRAASGRGAPSAEEGSPGQEEVEAWWKLEGDTAAGGNIR